MKVPLLVLALLATPCQAYDITHRDRGGNLGEYFDRFSALPKPIRVFAPCESSCAAAALMFGGCLGKGGELWVHAPSGGSPAANRVGKTLYLRMVGPKVRAWIMATGGLTSTLRKVPARLVPRCPT